MKRIKLWRLQQTLVSAKNDSKHIINTQECHYSRVVLYLDIVFSFFRYYVYGSQYFRKRAWMLDKKEKSIVLESLGKQNRENDDWIDDYYRNWRFLNKYSGLKWQKNPKKITKRNEAYIKQYKLGRGTSIQDGVTFIREHLSREQMIVGDNVLFARNVDIDYTGTLIIEDKVSFSEGVKILTHNHSIGVEKKDNNCINTPLVIRDGVWIGSRAFIMPGVSEIGRSAIIASGAFVTKKIPPYAIVMGNPAKIVGFRATTEEIVKYEIENYPEEKRLSYELLENNYKKYFLNRLDEIKQFSKL